VKEGHELLLCSSQWPGQLISHLVAIVVRLCFVRAHPRGAQRVTQRPACMRSKHRCERLVGPCGLPAARGRSWTALWRGERVYDGA